MIVRAVVDEFRVAWFIWLMVLMMHCIYTRHGGAEYRWYPLFFDLGGRFHDFARKKKNRDSWASVEYVGGPQVVL